MKKIVMFLLLLVLFIPNISAEELKLAPNAKSAIIIEAESGKVLFEKKADEKMIPASMTKMMSMLLILENIENGVLKWNQKITVSENASSMGGSQILLETGEKMTVRDLFKGISIASANDAVVALAEAIAGSEAAFVDMMNKKAKELNLKNTNFKTCHGLDAKDHYSSARDMSIIAQNLVKHKQVLSFTSVYEDYLRENTDRKIWLVNTNKLVRFYDGVDGLKTGYTKEAGYCLTATASKNGMRIIAIVMGEPESKMRNQEISQMLDYSFAQYKTIDLLEDKKNIGKYLVNNSKDKYVNIIPKNKAIEVLKKSERKPKCNYEISVDNLKAPIKKGDKVGEIIVYNGKKIINKTDLTVSKNVVRANIWQLYLRNLMDLFSGDISF